MLTARHLKPLLILCVTVTGSCLAASESPEPELESKLGTASAEQRVSVPPELAAPVREQLAARLELEPDPAVRAALVTRAKARAEFAARHAHDASNDSYTEGGHCNVRLTQCDPYPIKNHPGANAICSRVCVDMIAHCEDYSPAEMEFCCGHPDQDYVVNGKVIGHCMPSGEPNWLKRCAPGLNP